MNSVRNVTLFFDRILSRVNNPDLKDIEKGVEYFLKFMDDFEVVRKGLVVFQTCMILEFMEGGHAVSEKLGEMGYQSMLAILLETSRVKADTTLCLQGLTTLGTFDKNVPRIAGSGAIEAEISSIEMNCESGDIPEYAFVSLQGILAVSAEARERFLKCNGVEVTVRAMTRHAKSERVQALGSRVLANCTIETPMARERVLQCRGIEAIIWGMMLYKESEIVQVSGCNSLGTVAIRTKIDSLIRKGGVEAIIRALELHPDSKDVQKNAVYALGNITSSHKKSVEVIIAKGSVEAIIRAMKRHESVHDVVITACYSLSWIFSRQDIYEEHFTPDVREAAEAALARFPSDKPLRQRVDSLLRIEDPRAALAREQNVCSGVYIKKCGRPNCGTLKKYYCEECCAPQWAYECHTCSEGDGHISKCCVSCWNKFHKGHKGVKVFITTICESAFKKPCSPDSPSSAK